MKLTLTDEDSNKLEIWKQHLRQRCIMGDFYEEYEVKSQLSKGAFAKVFLAERDSKKYAVKCFKKDYLQECKFGKEGLREEIEGLRKFSH